MRSTVSGGAWWVGIGIAATAGIVVAGVAGRPWVGLGVLMAGLVTGAIGHRADETRTPVIRADGGASDIEMVVAIIRPGKLNDVKRALAEAGAASLTVTNVSGRGTQPTETGQWRGEQYIVDLHQKVKVECAVPDTETDVVVDAIQEASHTGEPGDGKIFVVPVLDACRVSTNERGLEAM